MIRPARSVNDSSTVRPSSAAASRIRSAIHGASANCTRWVTSCRHTHIRKSAVGTRSARSTATTFGATSSSDRENGSY